MAEILMIMPESYTELDANKYINEMGVQVSDMLSWVQSGTMYEMNNIMEQVGELPLGMTVDDIKIFDDGSGNHLWVKLIPES